MHRQLLRFGAAGLAALALSASLLGCADDRGGNSSEPARQDSVGSNLNSRVSDAVSEIGSGVGSLADRVSSMMQ